MARSRIRAQLRRARQEANRQHILHTVNTVDRSYIQDAIDQYIIFGGKRGNSKPRKLESFITNPNFK